MGMKNILLTLTLLISIVGFAQLQEVRGTILNIKGERVSGVEIYSWCSDSGKYGNSVFSDSRGNYKITIENCSSGKEIIFFYESTEKKRFFRKMNSFNASVDVLSSYKILNVQDGYDDDFTFTIPEIPLKYGDIPGNLPTEKDDNGVVWEYYETEDEDYVYKYYIENDLNLKDQKSFEKRFDKELKHPIEGIYSWFSADNLERGSTAIIKLNGHEDRPVTFIEIDLGNGTIVSEITLKNNNLMKKRAIVEFSRILSKGTR